MLLGRRWVVKGRWATPRDIGGRLFVGDVLSAKTVWADAANFCCNLLWLAAVHCSIF
jgi:hypothetical protein